jgi:hypothetical protein
MDNFLQENQVQTLESKKWVVKPNGFYVILYREDYSGTGWNELCKVIGCSPDSKEVSVLSFGFIES